MRTTLLLIVPLVLFATLLSAAYAAKPDAAREKDREKEQRINQLAQEVSQLDSQIRDAKEKAQKSQEQLSTATADQSAAKTELSKQTDFVKAIARELETTSKAAAEAKSRSDAADKSQREIASSLRTKLESGPDFLAAKKDLDEAREALSAARATALGPVRSQADYVAASKDAAEASKKVDFLKIASPVDSKALGAAAQDLLVKQGVVTSIEQKALAADPAYQAADDRVNAAVKAMGAQQQTMAEKIKNDPQRLVAMKEAADAEADEKSQLAAFSNMQQRAAAAKSALSRASDRLQSLTDQIARTQKELDRRNNTVDDLQQQRERKAAQLRAIR